MGLDWQALSLSGYFEAFEAREESNNPEVRKPAPASPEFRSQMKSIFAAEKQRREARDGRD